MSYDEVPRGVRRGDDNDDGVDKRSVTVRFRDVWRRGEARRNALVMGGGKASTSIVTAGVGG